MIFSFSQPWRLFFASVAMVALSLFAIPVIVHAISLTFVKYAISLTSFDYLSDSLGIDLDQDGDKDIVAISYHGKLAWFRNNGSQSFTQVNIDTTLSAPFRVSVADMNGDGYLDIVLADYGGAKLYWYKNNGSQTFTRYTIGSSLSGILSMSVADINGDGYKDILDGSRDNNTVTWWKNSGTGSFTKYDIDTSFSAPYGVAIGDFNGDGFTDVAAAGSTLAWWSNDGSQNFTKRTINTSMFHYQLTAGDVNGDGAIDLLTPNGGVTSVNWWQNSGTGSFTKRAIDTGIGSPAAIALADIDGNGTKDVVVPSQSSSTKCIYWYDNDGSQNFTKRTVDCNWDYSYQAFPVDIDGNGTIDIVSSTYNTSSLAWWYNPGADVTPPTITNITSTTANGSYRAGASVNISLTFSEAVTTSGTVTVTLDTGGSCTVSASNSSSASCTYVVSAGQTSADLTVSSVSGTITDQANNAMTNFVPTTNLAANKNIVIDTTAPLLSSVGVTPSSTGAVIVWSSNESATSKVQYGPTASYGTGTIVSDISPRVLSHAVSLRNLPSCASYHYRVISGDSAWNTSTGSDLTFTTIGCTGSSSVQTQTGGSIVQTSTGSLALGTGTGLTLVIPPYAASGTTVFQIKALNKTSVTAAAGEPSGRSQVGSVFNLLAFSGATTRISTFSKSLRVTVYYADADIVGIDESTLWVYRYDGMWNALSDCVVNALAKTVTCTTRRFSDFSIFGTPISSLSSSSSDAALSASTIVAGGVRSQTRQGRIDAALRILSRSSGSSYSLPPFSVEILPDESSALSSGAVILRKSEPIIRRLEDRLSQKIVAYPEFAHFFSRMLHRIYQRLGME